MRIVCGLKLDALEDNIDDDPVAMATADDICEDVCNCMDVDVAKGEHVYAHSNLISRWIEVTKWYPYRRKTWS